MRFCALAALFSIAAILQASRPSAIQDGAIWSHLSTGSWILQHHAIPRIGIFSQSAGTPWVDSSWLYDIVLATGFRFLGLKVFPFLQIVFTVDVAIVIYFLARRRGSNLWGAVALSALAQFVVFGLQPTPQVLSILLFGGVLALIMRSRDDADVRSLWWLVPLFLLWANLDPQFVLGLGLVLLLLVISAVELWLQRSGVTCVLAPRLPLAKLAVIVLACFLATFLTPYTIHLLPEALRSSYSHILFEYFGNMSSLGFRRPQDFVLMLLAMGAFVVLGRKRPVDLFEVSLMVLVLLLGFRIQRDSWTVVLATISVLGGFALPQKGDPLYRGNSKRELVGTALAVAVILFAVCFRLPNNDALMSGIGNQLPVRACDFIRSTQPPQPVFNAYEWGSFLTWYLPGYPVVIDDRLNLYGDEEADRYFKVVAGNERMEADPAFERSKIILVRSESGMAKALTTLPVLRSQFRVLYRDELATVFARN